jgi:CheY-like chemotaxis protein
MPRILVIDDSPSILELAETMLVSAGCEVVTCLDGETALRTLSRESFDVILTDIYMPGEDGLEVIRKAHQMGVRAPIIAVSGATGARNMLTVAKLMGAAQLLPKPFSRLELLAAVDAALAAPRL